MSTQEFRDAQFASAQRAYDNMEPPWTDAYTGTRWVGEWETHDGDLYEDVEVELDDGRVMSAKCCGENANEELLKDLEERYVDD